MGDEIDRWLPDVSAGTVSDWAEDALIAASTDVHHRGAVRAWVQQMREGLALPDDTGLESLLVQRVSLCQLAVNDAERRRAQIWGCPGGVSHESADFWDRHVSRLNADLLQATRTLATVRKLRRPVVQVNVAKQQVNVAG